MKKSNSGKDRRNNNLKIVFIVLQLAVVFILCINDIRVSAADEKTDIRVGLEANYHNKDIITIYNSTIRLGFCSNDSFKSEIILKSDKGFSFEPVKKSYYYDNESFSSYGKAKLAAENLLVDGIKTEICLCGKKNWKLYFEKTDGKNDSSFSKASDSELVRLSFGKLSVLIDGNQSKGYPQAAPAGKADTLSLGTRHYRGRLEIGRYGSDKLTAVNIVNIEAYLKGVVTCEMNSLWEIEALKAQAVCARSYAMTKCSFSADCSLKKPYVIIDTSASQVYGGAGKETKASVSAVNETKKQILCSQGKPIITYYFSTSGGATEFSSDIWGGNSFNYVSVFDEYETEPEREPWLVRYKYSEIEAILKNNGYVVSNITEIFPEVYSDSGRVSLLKIKHSGGTVEIPGNKLTSMFDLYSTKFRVITSDNTSLNYLNLISADDTSGNLSIDNNELYTISGSGVITAATDNALQIVAITDDNMYNFPIGYPEKNEFWFLGMGWGHGIGMSQSGANGLAKKGFDYKSILDYYYKNTQLDMY